MIRILLIFACVAWAIASEGAQTLIHREWFDTAATYSGSVTGTFHQIVGTIASRAVGPYTNGAAAPGWSAVGDPSGSGGRAAYILTNAPENAAASFGVLSGRFRFVSFGAAVSSGHCGYLLRTLGAVTNTIAAVGLRNDGNIGGNGSTGLVTLLPNRWYEIALMWWHPGDSRAQYRVYVRDLTNSAFTLSYDSGLFFASGTVDFRDSRYADLVDDGSGSGGSYFWRGRAGAISLYSITSSNDVAAVSNMVDQANVGATWFVNPGTGNDTNSGATPSKAWKTASKINQESAGGGLFAASSFTNGDTLVFDTTAAPLDLSATNLALATGGLRTVATNSQYWTNLLSVDLTNAQFSSASSLPNVWQITTVNNAGFGQSNITVWEDMKWMNHPEGATFASVSNYMVTNAGSFWTDGSSIYVHPFSGTDPRSDGKSYTRSVARSADGFEFAINLNMSNMFFSGCYAGKTSMVRTTDNTDGLASYVVGTGDSFSGTCIISNCYLYYGSKHILGLVCSAANSDVTVVDVEAEQSPPGVSASAWVSFMDGTHGESNNVHRYIRIRTDTPVGRIGSTAGYPFLVNGSTMLMHNSSSGVQFRDVFLIDSRISGIVGLNVCSNAIVQNCEIGGLQPAAVVSNICLNTLFTGIGLDLEFSTASNTVVRNCIAVQTNFLQAGVWAGWLLQGSNVVIENCTLDFSGVTSSAPGSAGMLKRFGHLDLKFRNNAVVFGTNAYGVFHGFTTNDTYAISNNVYQLGTPGTVVNLYTNGAAGSDRTFAQWQVLGFDANSVSVPDARLNPVTHAPLGDSMVKDFGVSQGVGIDFSGKTFANRNDAGAIEYRRGSFNRFSR